MRSVVLSLLLAWSAASSAQTEVSPLTVRGDFTGNWTDPLVNRQGVQIEIIDARRAVIAWFTYNTSGDPVWLFGVGEVENAIIRADMLRFRGGTFPPDQSDPELIESEFWGDLMLEFEDCNTGRMQWDPVLPEFTAGEVEINRLTSIEGLRCGQAEQFSQTVSFSLDAGPGRWQTLFSDFTEATREAILETVESEWGSLPQPLESRNGFMLAGTNFSDDLAMMAFAPLAGLEASTEFRLEFDLTFASNVPRGCFGVGGSPGDDVFIRAGAASVEPRVIEQDGQFRFNVDTGGGPFDGLDAITLGDFANSRSCDDGVQSDWELKTLTSRGREFVATTDEEGRLWVYALTDSGFEGRTTWFMTDFTIRLQPMP